LRRAFPFALTGLVANAQVRLAPLVLGYLSTAGEVAAFGVASRLESSSRRIPSAAFGAALPVFSREVYAGNHRPSRTWFDRALRWFAVLAAAAFVLGARPIVRLTYGPAFAGAAWPLMWAGFGLLPWLINSSRKVFLYAAGLERIAVGWSAAALGIQTLACLALVPRLGAAGAMCALALGEAAIWLPLRIADRRAAAALPGATPGPPDRAARPDARSAERAGWVRPYGGSDVNLGSRP
jgi:O-antigen/teichoic acid export membrane protein